MKTQYSQSNFNDENDTITLSNEVYSSTGSRKIKFISTFPTPQLFKSRSTQDSFLVKETHLNILPNKKDSDNIKTNKFSNSSLSTKERMGDFLENSSGRKSEFSLLGKSKKKLTLEDNISTNEDDKIYGLSDVSDFELNSNEDSDNDDFLISRRNEFQLKKL